MKKKRIDKLILIVTFLAFIALAATSCEQVEQDATPVEKELSEVSSDSMTFRQQVEGLVPRLNNNPEFITHTYFYNRETATIGDYIGPCYGYPDEEMQYSGTVIFVKHYNEQSKKYTAAPMYLSADISVVSFPYPLNKGEKSNE